MLRNLRSVCWGVLGIALLVTRGTAQNAYLDAAIKELAGHESTLKLFGVGDCRVADGFATNVFYNGTGATVCLNYGRAGSFLNEHELRFRLPASRCPSLEWGIWGGGPGRIGSTKPEALIKSDPWPPIVGRAQAVIPADSIDVFLLPGADRSGAGVPRWKLSIERFAIIENCIREYNRRRLKFMTGLFLNANAGGAQFDGIPDSLFGDLWERFKALTNIYTNYCFIERTDIEMDLHPEWRKEMPTFILEEWRVIYEHRGGSPALMPWSANPADLNPSSSDVIAAVNAAKAMPAGNLVIGGAWIGQACAGLGAIASIAGGGTPQAELVLRSAIAAGKKPDRVIWGLDPLALTAPKTEAPIGPLEGPAWPPIALSGAGGSSSTAKPIILGHGTNVARGQGVWEFGLEYYYLFEAGLRECARRKIPVLLVLAPNDVGIPSRAYQGLTERLRALTLQYTPYCSFVWPADLAGKTGAAAAQVIGGYLANWSKGVMTTAITIGATPTKTARHAPVRAFVGARTARSAMFFDIRGRRVKPALAMAPMAVEREISVSIERRGQAPY